VKVGVALAGSLKAGKSTLLNSLVGQDIAPTDATECTKVVTWYRNGVSPSVTAWYDGDRAANVPVQRRDGRLTFDLGALTAAQVDRLDVEWPASTLAQTTIIDTPGTSSLSRDVSARTLAMLTPENSSSGADAVVYLLRTLNATDVSFLGQIGASIGQLLSNRRAPRLYLLAQIRSFGFNVASPEPLDALTWRGTLEPDGNRTVRHCVRQFSNPGDGLWTKCREVAVRHVCALAHAA
jgi:hypothetical protein